MTMTLEQVRDRFRVAQNVGGVVVTPHEAKILADAIDARLTQPAQSVDAECLRELVTKWEARGAEERRYSGEYYSGRAQAYDACSEELADMLTAALQEKGNG